MTSGIPWTDLSRGTGRLTASLYCQSHSRAGGRRKTYPGPRSYVGADAISDISHVRKTTNKMVLISDKAKRKPLSISKSTLDRTMLDLQTCPPTSAERHEVTPDTRRPRSDFGT